MGLSILSVAYPFAPVSPDAVGGAEQIVCALDAALTRRGHRSLVLACEGSRVHGEWVSSGAPPLLIDARARADAKDRQRATLAMLLRTRRFDLIHLHGIDFLDYLPDAGPPVVVTLHMPLAWYPRCALTPARTDVQLVCVSDNQRRSNPVPAARLRTIANGVALDALHARVHKRQFVLALGRICIEKGLHHALDAARNADVALLHGGCTFGYPEHRAYLRDFVEPRLDQRRRLLGPLSLDRKRRLLGAARCLVVPSSAPETSSLVAMEALACGTPVVAFSAGALPELIEHGRTGFVVEDAAQMAEAIGETRRLRAADCREAAEQQFSADAMTRRYIALYQELAAAPVHRARSAAIAVEELTTLEALERLAPEWIALWQRTPAATVFQRPEWLLAWCRTLLTGALRVVVLRGEGRLIGIAPLYVREQAGARVLALLGAGVSDYLDVLIDPRHASDAERVLRAWFGAARGFDLCAFECLRSCSPLLALCAPHGWLDATHAEHVAPALVLTDAPDACTSAASPAFAASLRRAQRRAARCEIARETADDANAGEFLAALVRLHAARWSERGAPGVLCDDRVQAFHRQLIEAFTGSGLVQFWGLRAGATLIAVAYGFCDRGVVRLYLSGFDPAWSRCSVGTLVVQHAIESAFASGAREVDFLRGAEPYKYRFGAHDRSLQVRTLARAVRAREVAATLPERAGIGAHA